MGSKYSWKFWCYKVEFTPFKFLRVMKKHKDGYWRFLLEI